MPDTITLTRVRLQDDEVLRFDEPVTVTLFSKWSDGTCSLTFTKPGVVSSALAKCGRDQPWAEAVAHEVRMLWHFAVAVSAKPREATVGDRILSEDVLAHWYVERMELAEVRLPGCGKCVCARVDVCSDGSGLYDVCGITGTAIDCDPDECMDDCPIANDALVREE